MTPETGTLSATKSLVILTAEFFCFPNEDQCLFLRVHARLPTWSRRARLVQHDPLNGVGHPTPRSDVRQLP
jgi:hypothetical protein